MRRPALSGSPSASASATLAAALGIALALALALAAPGCLRDNSFHCAADGECGSGGHCEVTRHCSVDDSSCGPGGHRYGDSAGSLAGQCVGADQPDAATPSGDAADASDQPDGPTGAPGSECIEGIPLEATGCAAAVCDVEPSCCEVAWSSVCVSLAEEVPGCDVRCSNTVVIGGGPYGVAFDLGAGVEPWPQIWTDKPGPNDPAADTDWETNAFAWADFDHDGDADLATGGQRQLRIYRNDGWVDGHLVLTLLWHRLDDFIAYSAAWADVDKDGWLDVAFGGYGGVRLATNVHAGDATIDFNLSDVIPDAPADRPEVYKITWGDYDHDDDLDLAVGRAAAAIVYRNDNGTLVPDLTWTGPAQIKALAWCDLDGDRYPELVLGGADGLVVHDNQGGTLHAPSTEIDDGWTVSAVCADLDRDGDLDFAAGIWQKATVVVRNDGGTLTIADTSDTAKTTRGLDVGDLDGDRDLDLILIGNLEDAAPLTYTVMTNRLEAGSFVFTDQTTEVGLEPPVVARAGDIGTLPLRPR